ncbi:hypothetical protein [Mucilaginibacter segetis]|uniref:Uncharacterized protein n=1 Tax=Mucilaginibacter segetis TaxID=2793071 RepID=A0A934PWP3_9SPHI|nr:hypothetical protein [Mucilaginibacter segetis]MBK0380471.1 hypothetical protein [Mucilaginibacter segetis]
MEKVYISNCIKYEILKICGLNTSRPYNLVTDIPLKNLGFRAKNNRCELLERRLQVIADEYNTGKQIAKGTISENITVKQCIQFLI